MRNYADFDPKHWSESFGLGRLALQLRETLKEFVSKWKSSRDNPLTPVAKS
jgi:hypothetical protein